MPSSFPARVLWPLLALVGVLVLLPLFATRYPPLHDYPFHLARADALAVLAGQVPGWTVYRLGSFLLPNEAMDVVTLGLTAILPPEMAARVFLAIVLLLMLGGTVALHRALHGRASPWPLLAGFLLYNWILAYGFTNYLFGVGVMLWGLAAWQALGSARPVRRAAAGGAIAVVLLFCHLVAFGLFAVVLGGMALGDAVARWRQGGGWRDAAVPLLEAGVPVAAALAVFVALSPTAAEVRQPVEYHPWIGWKPLMAYRTLLGTRPWLDLATLAPVAGLVLAAALWRRVGLARGMAVPLLLLGATYLAMPYGLFGSLYADARLPVAIALVAIAATDMRAAGRWLLPAVAGCLLLLGVRGAAIAADWRASGTVLAAYAAAFDTLPAGSVLYAATAEPYPTLAYRGPADLARWRPPLKHVASLASVGRAVFVPSTWADPMKQPIVLPAEHLPAKRLHGDNPFKTPDAAALAAVLAEIRAVPAAAGSLHLLLQGTPAGGVPAGLVELAGGPGFRLFRVE